MSQPSPYGGPAVPAAFLEQQAADLRRSARGQTVAAVVSWGFVALIGLGQVARVSSGSLLGGGAGGRSGSYLFGTAVGALAFLAVPLILAIRSTVGAHRKRSQARALEMQARQSAFGGVAGYGDQGFGASGYEVPSYGAPGYQGYQGYPSQPSDGRPSDAPSSGTQPYGSPPSGSQPYGTAPSSTDGWDQDRPVPPAR
ncbi:hypothetical protein C8046_16585 [Serinibacter arcticus]|uniref:Uncharacterized protein n=1 Tax=Serinibacter arcticus TaxID=1655435 RepID=A0A2U1ZYE5_9MICO|nr:hypothetical protein [Serinibacter arcticus]PWD52018.1 hypothetical protein C8046_16585 [Serinibacter arcticus]